MTDGDAPSFDATLNEAQRAQHAGTPHLERDEADVDEKAEKDHDQAEDDEGETSAPSIDKLAAPRSQLHSATMAPAGWQERTLPHRDGSSSGGPRRVDSASVTQDAPNAASKAVADNDGKEEENEAGDVQGEDAQEVVDVHEDKAEAEAAADAVEKEEEEQQQQQQGEEADAADEQQQQQQQQANEEDAVITDPTSTTSPSTPEAVQADTSHADRQLVVRHDAPTAAAAAAAAEPHASKATTEHKAAQPPHHPRRPSRRPSQQQQQQQQQQQYQQSLNALAMRRMSMLEGGLTTGLHLNALQMTAAEEYALFRRRHHVAATYKGPVYVAEDVQVACHACGCPVDPVRRVPAGQLFFHQRCIACCLCGRRGEAEPFRQVGDFVICSFCAERGYARCVPRTGQRVARGQAMSSLPHYITTSSTSTSSNGNDVEAMDGRQRCHARPEACTVNLPSLPGVTAPSLAINAQLHTSRNTSRRSFALMQRQQYYTQNDVNLIMRPPAQQHGGGSRKASTAAAATAIDAEQEVRALKMRRASQA